jgi:predicted metal-dependent enzyme (double-stranded beta helix superfamily)
LDQVIDQEFAAGDVGMFGSEVIHSVDNPLSHEYTGAIHVYGGDFLNEPRSVWLGEPPTEQPATGATMQRFFVEPD